MFIVSAKKTGFTIVELIVVIFILGILATITLVSFRGISKQAIVASLKSDLNNASQQLKIFKVHNDRYPETISNNCETNPDTSTNKCLRPSPNTSFEQYDSSSPYHSFSLRAKNGDNVFMITDSTPPSEVAPLTAIAATNGAVQVGSVLTAGALTPSEATVTYKWQASSFVDGTYSDIVGAINKTYTLSSGDSGKYIKVVVVGTGTFWGNATSSAVGPVAQPSPIFASGGVITTAGGFRIHTFNPGTYNITSSASGSIEIDIKAAGGGGNGLNWDDCYVGSLGTDGGLSSIVIGSNNYLANGGLRAPCYSNGPGGTVSVPAGFTNTASPAIGGGSSGGAGVPWDGDEWSNGGTTGGAGGRVSGILGIVSGQAITVSVGSGGVGGCNGGCGSAGSPGQVVIKY